MQVKFHAAVTSESLKRRRLSICVAEFFFFFGRGALQDMCREWPTSRFAAV